eukprot:g3885.t1
MKVKFVLDGLPESGEYPDSLKVTLPPKVSFVTYSALAKKLEAGYRNLYSRRIRVTGFLDGRGGGGFITNLQADAMPALSAAAAAAETGGGGGDASLRVVCEARRPASTATSVASSSSSSGRKSAASAAGGATGSFVSSAGGGGGNGA